MLKTRLELKKDAQTGHIPIIGMSGGQIPTIKIGRLLRVPVRALERMLERVGEPAA